MMSAPIDDETADSDETADPNGVNDRESFVEFVYHMRDDWEANQADPTKATYWENPDMSRFLDTLGHWVRHSMPNIYKREAIAMPADEFYEQFAQLLFVAASYE